MGNGKAANVFEVEGGKSIDCRKVISRETNISKVGIEKCRGPKNYPWVFRQV
jgi:hypothetical protein